MAKGSMGWSAEGDSDAAAATSKKDDKQKKK